ncbi:Creatinase/Prolidase N-terminal domain-containing protein [Gracilibacillus orientalis]|uniref:Creatinase/Prolidase N-terminal domain-containing protein n=1 Tax=Gracilibacillus orientalis TaxID=334253 RepID=A0A1I4HU55_9BACI|nr:aminopeptidase P family N-terminal domain-containing protein [Gracilibacillus orientalis]SFL45297.1 Creatinase/Prolidase N-terminal domain-containing protein [Gracilibacillus orientalis]
MNKRLAMLTNWLNEENIDVLFINSIENVYYLSNFYTDPHFCYNDKKRK